MRCPFCNADDDKVIDSRAAESGAAIRRRRECVACGKRFTTYEHVELGRKLAVSKKDGARVPYDRGKIAAGLEHACYKRPIPSETLAQLVDEIEEDIFRRFDKEVESLEIGRTVAERLKVIDRVAYVRFASVYKQFRDVDDFQTEVSELLEGIDDVLPDQGTLF